MSIWDLYRKPAKYIGDKVPGLDAVYYTGNEGLQVPSTDSSQYASIMAFFYLSGLATYVFCTVTGRRAQRLYSTLTLAAVPAVWILNSKGDDTMVSVPYQLPLEYRLEYYPLTRRALERAIEDVSQGKSTSPLLSQLEADEQEFSLFKTTFNKHYSHVDSLSRFQKFKNNLSFIHRFNSNPSSVILGVTQFADLDFSEFSSIYLFKEEPVPTMIPSDPNPISIDPLPSSIDWVSKGKVTSVKNQGQCGSCYSFASTGAIESAWAINQSLTTNLPIFSEQQLMDCSENEGCNGGYAWLCFKYVVENGGLNSELNYPYKAVDQTCNKSQELNHDISISSFQNVTAFNYRALMKAVTIQPVATSVEADIQWMLYKSGIITNNCGIALNHAVLITGYDTTNVPNWMIKNSWGTSWGQNGYIQLGLSAGYGVCGINTRPVYPII